MTPDINDWDLISEILLVVTSLAGLWIWSMRGWFKDPQNRVHARRIGVGLCMGAFYLLVAEWLFGPNGRWAIVFVAITGTMTLKLLGISWFDIDRILPPADDPVTREESKGTVNQADPEAPPRSFVRITPPMRQRARQHRPPPGPEEERGKVLDFTRRSGTD